MLLLGNDTLDTAPSHRSDSKRHAVFINKDFPTAESREQPSVSQNSHKTLTKLLTAILKVTLVERAGKSQ